MAEIKRELIHMQSFLDDDDLYMIDADHTLKDILRHVLKEAAGDKDEFLYFATEVFNEAD